MISTGKRLAWRLMLSCVGGGLAVIVAAILLNPPLLVALIMAGNGVVAIWWGIHVFVTRRPW